ncbi:BON domain-containing protein [Trinickia violacea]|uniref:BON domain-containing protein n=1 Tax=Trinickia violacea TaxID=2571746 RepID=A0A4P8IMF5_9BURK|nr:BON domain-containing protein [Trinickia violacea]QCP48715.1 BON domain-containing protein [Trinickia violacea]
MKAIQAIKLASGALIIAASVSAFAQASGTDMASAPAAGMSKHHLKMSPAERALSKKVRAALAKAKGVSAANIIVRAQNDAVILEGSVPDQGQSDKATTVAQGVAGVGSVKNDLTVKEEGQ